MNCSVFVNNPTITTVRGNTAFARALREHCAQVNVWPAANVAKQANRDLAMETVKCRNCGATLILSATRGKTCGRCGNPIAKVQQSQKWPFVSWVTKLFPPEPTQKEIPVKSTKRAGDEQNGLLAASIDDLARRSWGGRDEIARRSLFLTRNRIDGLASQSEIVKEMLDHVRRVAPALDVPMLTPRIVTERLCEAAGQFVEQDGWVKIAVGSHFFDNVNAAVAILCHELCHYVLEANGIRKKPTLANERITDTAMFVFGLGDLFLAGYKVPGTTEYRTGHRLGYLLDTEYNFADQYVRELRTSENFLRTVKGRSDNWSWDRSQR